MDFALSDEQRMIAEMAQSFFRENATSARVRAAMAADGFDRDLWSAFCGELGLAGIGVPEELGGVGLGMVELALVAEAAGAMVAPLPLLGQAMTAAALVASGSEEQCATSLSAIAAGEVICAAARTVEPPTEADGCISGTVPFVAHGGVANRLFLASSGRAWLIDLGHPGVSIRSHVTMDQTRPLATIALEDVPALALEDAEKAREAASSAGWIVLAAEALGGAQEALDRTVAYSRERVQFGRPIGSFQAYKHRLADMMVEIEQARSAVYWAACAVDENSEEAPLALHAAKSFCADTYFRCAADMIQFHGGIGFTWEHDAHLFFKRARSIQTMQREGSWHRERIAALVLGEAP